MSGNVPKMRVELRCENLYLSGRAQAIPDTLRVRALAFDHSCDLPFGSKVDVTPGRAGPHRQVGAFFRGVI